MTMGRLEGRVAIVTGAGQGVGRGIALAFAREGAKVVVAVRNRETGPSVVAEIAAIGGDAIFAPCDVSKPAEITATIAATLTEYGRLDILVNNAQDVRALGKAFAAGEVSFLATTDETIRIAMDSGFMGTVWFMKAAYPHLKDRGGRIINFGSLAGVRGDANLLAYNASKEAIRAATRTAAREWGAAGITVNCVCPVADSPAMVGAYAEQARMAPMARLGSCEQDIGRTCVFLASDDAAYMTGYTFHVDGGMAIDAGR